MNKQILKLVLRVRVATPVTKRARLDILLSDQELKKYDQCFSSLSFRYSVIMTEYRLFSVYLYFFGPVFSTLENFCFVVSVNLKILLYVRNK